MRAIVYTILMFASVLALTSFVATAEEEAKTFDWGGKVVKMVDGNNVCYIYVGRNMDCIEGK